VIPAGGSYRFKETAMSNANIHKILAVVEETQKEIGRKVDQPTRKAAAIAVIENPYGHLVT
jgi:hypothetical protein